jgi:hypothetical protein
VLRRDALVAEVPIDLVDAVEPADHQALEVQLRRDTQVELHVERVVVRHEGFGRGAAWDGLHHRGLDLEKTARVQEGPHLADQPALDRERLAHLRVHHEVDVAPAVPCLHVLEAVPLLRQRPERLGEELEAADGDGQLAGPRPEELPGHADEVSDVEVREERVAIAETVGAGVELYLPGLVSEMREAGLAVVPERDHPPREDHGAGLLEVVFARGLEAAPELARPVRDREAVSKRVGASGAKGLELFEAPPHEVIRLRLGRLGPGRWRRGSHARPASQRQDTPR